ncbi:methyltransferase domain-containing protein [Sphingomonas sp. ID0503]|uniref:methyltransferase domain-containing protein n=1 Tax=Sphingomonas sp. ID0503 TaxID=3399691 RepID=UPI003AFAEB76
MVDSRRSTIDSGDYWDKRYATGRNSGAGSYGRLAKFKAAFLNRFIEANGVESVADFGCGDGNQLSLMNVRGYIGVDVSKTVLDQLKTRFADRPELVFRHTSELADVAPCELAMSIDVIYHLVEDDVFTAYIDRLFAFATKFVVIYSDDREVPYGGKHVRHRKFSDYVAASQPDWSLAGHVPNPYPFDPANKNKTSFADFYIYARQGEAAVIPPAIVPPAPARPAPRPPSRSSFAARLVRWVKHGPRRVASSLFRHR